MTNMEKVPKNHIVYHGEINVRFNDLDPYGHVNASIFLDYIISSRWSFLEKELQVTVDELIKKGLGFFLVNSNINYLKPIYGNSLITVDSWVTVVDKASLTVEFEITNQSKKTVSTGSLVFAIIDLKTKHPMSLPKWAEYLFIEDTNG